jgi:ATP-binding cassette subfamily C protein
MVSDAIGRGKEELRALGRKTCALYWVVALFSLAMNLLVLTGPLYMLQVYDRVLGSGSQGTLFALTLIALFAYAGMGVLDSLRSRIMARIAAQFQISAERRLFDAMMRHKRLMPASPNGEGLAHLDAIVRCMASPAVAATFDLPWTPLFFGVIFVFHPLLGILSVAGAFTLVLIAIANQKLSKRGQISADQNAALAAGIAAQMQAESEVVHALSMQSSGFAHWKSARERSLAAQLSVSNVSAYMAAMTRTLRLMLQSVMLGLGAWLVISQQMTAGGMIAGSILLGRALTPVETLLNLWPLIQRAHGGWLSAAKMLGQFPQDPEVTVLPKPRSRLQANGVTVVAPGMRRASLRGISFQLEPGEAMGVIGPSGSGKSTLARVVTGVWPIAGGTLRLDGAGLAQYGVGGLGQHIGYLPQRLQFFDGSIAQNIAHLSPTPDDTRIVAAAKHAAAHEMILDLPDGYDTVLNGNGGALSGGQMQRIGLARALYHEPAIVVLDEPNSNLDNAGSTALNQAIRYLKDNGRAVLVFAHRPTAIQECGSLLVLDNGVQAAFGPKEEVIAAMIKNSSATKLSLAKNSGAA